VRGGQEFLAQRGVGRGQGLRRVKRLGADLAHVVHAHQRRGVAPLAGIELGVVGRHDRAGPHAARPGEQGAQSAIGCAEECIHGASVVPLPDALTQVKCELAPN
jgi:hypothetical protein